MAHHIHVHIHRATTADRKPIAKAVRALARDQHAPEDVSTLVAVLMEAIAARQGQGKTADADFDESKHKRDEGGKFTAGGMNAEQHKAAAEHHSKVAKASKDPMEAIHNTDLATRHSKAAEKLSAAASLTGVHQGQALEDASYHAKHAEDFKKQFGIKGLEVSSRSASQGEKPTKATASGAKAATHELLSSGHPFSVDELCKATGASKASVMTALSDLKNPKYAGKLGALEIVKRSDGMFHVQKKEGAGLAPKPGPDGQHMGKHPELAAAERRVAENPRTTVTSPGLRSPGEVFGGAFEAARLSGGTGSMESQQAKGRHTSGPAPASRGISAEVAQQGIIRHTVGQGVHSLAPQSHRPGAMVPVMHEGKSAKAKVISGSAEHGYKVSIKGAGPGGDPLIKHVQHAETEQQAKVNHASGPAPALGDATHKKLQKAHEDARDAYELKRDARRAKGQKGVMGEAESKAYHKMNSAAAALDAHTRAARGASGK